MTPAVLDTHRARTHPAASARTDARPRTGTRSTALPAFARLGDDDVLGRHYALVYRAYRREDRTAGPKRTRPAVASTKT